MKMYFFSQCEANLLGPMKKIDAQVRSFNEMGIPTTLITPEKCLRKATFIERLSRRLPFFSVAHRYSYQTAFQDADAYYIRFMASDLYFVRFLKKLKENNPNAKMVLEFPEFPYVGSWWSIGRFPLWIKDRIYYREYKKYVDRVADLTRREFVYGIKTINFINGIIVDEETKKQIVAQTDIIHMIAVSGMCIYHGFDRLIQGLHEYYQKDVQRKIVLHLVGAGPYLSLYKELVEKYQLGEYVKFYGVLTGEKLAAVYNQCEMGVECLGLHRKDCPVSSSLKTREYLAKGLPIIGGCAVDVLDEKFFPYFKRFPSDETPIDMDAVVQFYDSIYHGNETKQQIIDRIRDYAYKTCDMKVTMQPIVDYIKGDPK